MTIIEIPHSTVVSYNNIAISWIKWRCKCYVEMWPTLCLWNNLLMWRYLVFCKYRCAFSSKLNSIDDNFCPHFPIEIQIIFHREPDNKTKMIPLYWHRPSQIICQLKQIALQKAEFSWIYYNLSISQRHYSDIPVSNESVYTYDKDWHSDKCLRRDRFFFTKNHLHCPSIMSTNTIMW